LWVIFALLDPDPDSESGSGSTDPIESGSNPDPQPCSHVRFMSADEEDFVVCNKDKVGELEVVRIRSNREREDLNKKVVPEELRGRIDQVETKMVKKFQKWQVSF